MFGTHISSGGKAPNMCTLAPQVPRPPTLGSQLQLPVTVSQQRHWSQSDRSVLAYGSTQSQRGSRLSPLSISQVCFHFLDLRPVEEGAQSLDQLQVSGDIDWNGEIPYTTPTIGSLCGIGDRYICCLYTNTAIGFVWNRGSILIYICYMLRIIMWYRLECSFYQTQSQLQACIWNKGSITVFVTSLSQLQA